MRAHDFIIEKAGTPAPAQTADVKASIHQTVDNIFDIDELNKVYSYLRKIDIGKGFDEIFNKDQDLRQVHSVLSSAIIEASGTFEEKLAFAKELANEGIINIRKLLTPGVTQSLNAVVITKYPNIFNQIAPELMNIAGSFKSGKTKTNRGKGEFFLAICSPYINLSKAAGDLDIEGNDVEVKSNLARIKGRKGYGSTDAAYSALKKEIEKFKSSNIKDPDVKLPEYSVTIGARSTFWSQFGPDCVNNGVPAEKVVSFVQKKLIDVVRSLYLDLDRGTASALMGCVGPTGVLDFNAFVPLVKQLAYSYYQSSDGFSGILFINGDTLNSTFVDSAQTFQSSIRIAKLGFETGQQNGMQVKLQ